MALARHPLRLDRRRRRDRHPAGLLRGLLLALLVPAMIMDGDGRGLHDRAAGSIVVDLTAARKVS